MTMRRIAIVTSNKWFRRCREDLHLEKKLAEAGFCPEIVPWSGQVDWIGYDLIILRSMWDYHHEYEAFSRWLRELAMSGAAVANGVERILQNINKAEQIKALAHCAVHTVPSVICRSSGEILEAVRTAQTSSVVVKPGISSSGYHTYRIDKTDPEHIGQLRVASEVILEEAPYAIVQPYLSSICNGEVSLIFFRGVLSHGVIRYPGVLHQKKVPIPLADVPKAYRAAGGEVLRSVGGDELLYVRIDLVEHNDTVYIMEVELTEPDLYLTLSYPKQIDPTTTFIAALKGLCDPSGTKETRKGACRNEKNHSVC